MTGSLKASLAAVLILTALLPIGCSRAREASDSASQSAITQGASVAPLPPSPATAGSDSRNHLGYDSVTAEDPAKSSEGVEGGARAVPSQPMIIRSGSIELRVKDVEKSLPAIKAAAKANGADIAEMSLSGGAYAEPGPRTSAAGPSYATITLRVPADRLDALTSAVARLGEVITQTETSSDVTEQAVDMEARLRNLRAEEARLRTFLERANKVDELLSVQRELSRVRGDIEAMDAQLTYLKRQVARATLVVTLSEPGPVVGPENPWYGIREAFSAGVRGAIEVVKVLITLAIAAMPLIVVAACVIWLIVRLVRRNSARRAAASVAAQMPPHESGQRTPES